MPVMTANPGGWNILPLTCELVGMCRVQQQRLVILSAVWAGQLRCGWLPRNGGLWLPGGVPQHTCSPGHTLIMLRSSSRLSLPV